MIRVAIVGAGHWGPNFIRNFHGGPDSRVAYVIDRDEGRLRQVHSRFPDIQLERDVAKALADPLVDAMVIATPSNTHYLLAKAALEAKKHVLVEKPISTDATQGEELCDLASKLGRTLLVGHVFLYNPAVRHVRQYIEQGGLGQIYYLSMARTNLGPIRIDVNASWDLASHDISIADYWLGHGAITASAVGGNWINKGIDDAVFITLRYPNNILVSLHVSWLSPRKAREITVVGDRKMLTFDDMNLLEPIRIYDKRVTEDRTPGFVDNFATFRASVREGDITIPKIGIGEPLKEECEEFLNCITSARQPLTPGPDAVRVVRTLEAIERSIQHGGSEERVRS